MGEIHIGHDRANLVGEFGSYPRLHSNAASNESFGQRTRTEGMRPVDFTDERGESVDLGLAGFCRGHGRGHDDTRFRAVLHGQSLRQAAQYFR